jgi:hypothetical protein
MPLMLGHAFVGAVDSAGVKFTPERLNTIILYSQYPDAVRLFDAVYGGIRSFNDGPYGEIPLLYQEAIHGLNGRTVRENQDFNLNLIANNRGNDAVVGMALHPYVDAQFHAQRGGNLNPTYDELMEMKAYPPRVGHAFHGSHPDYMTPDRAHLQAIAQIKAFEVITGVSADTKLEGEEYSIREKAMNTLNRALAVARADESTGMAFEQRFNDAARLHLPPGTPIPSNGHLPKFVLPWNWSWGSANPVTLESTFAETSSYLRSSGSNANALEFTANGIDAAILISNKYLKHYGGTSTNRNFQPLDRGNFGLYRDDGQRLVPAPALNNAI